VGFPTFMEMVNREGVIKMGFSAFMEMVDREGIIKVMVLITIQKFTYNISFILLYRMTIGTILSK